MAEIGEMVEIMSPVKYRGRFTWLRGLPLPPSIQTSVFHSLFQTTRVEKTEKDKKKIKHGRVTKRISKQLLNYKYELTF